MVGREPLPSSLGGRDGFLSLRRDRADVTGGEPSNEALVDESGGGDGGQDGLLEKTSGDVVDGGLGEMGSEGLFPAPPPKYRRIPFIANKERLCEI